MVSMETVVENKYECLKERLARMRGVVVAFSGGADSSLLLYVARAVLKDRCIAATIDSPLHQESVLGNALETASPLGVEHVVVDLNEPEDPEFRLNPPRRCYICKRLRFGRLTGLARARGLEAVADGTNAEDAGRYRPGIRAGEELGVVSPLRECGFLKSEVRSLSRELGLGTWNLPSDACLATRIPYFQEITPEKLSAVEMGEEYLSSLGMSPVRLRYMGDDAARIEVDSNSIGTLVANGAREGILEKMRELGFTYVTVDLGGYRTGSMDEALAQ